MFASLTNPIKIALSVVVGLMLGLLIGWLVMLVTYEGIRLPIFGQIVNGRVADAVEAATETLAKIYEDGARKAVEAEKRRQEQATAVATEDYRRRLEAYRAAEAQTTDKLKQEIAAHEREVKALGRSCAVIDDADRDWLLNR